MKGALAIVTGIAVSLDACAGRLAFSQRGRIVS